MLNQNFHEIRNGAGAYIHMLIWTRRIYIPRTQQAQLCEEKLFLMVEAFEVARITCSCSKFFYTKNQTLVVEFKRL